MSLPTPDPSVPDLASSPPALPSRTSYSLPSGKHPHSLSQPGSGIAEGWTSPLTPTSFTSLLPLVDGSLATLAGLAGSDKGIDGEEAGKAVVGTARELFRTLEGMKASALDLPGGHLTTRRIEELERIMQGDVDKRRETLRKLAEVEMPTADRIRKAGEGAGGELVDGERIATAGTEPAE